MDYTQGDVDRILEASEKATPGEWLQGTDLRQIESVHDGTIVCNISGAVSHPKVLADSEFIAGAPILAEEVKRLRGECKRLNDVIYRIQSYHARGS